MRPPIPQEPAEQLLVLVRSQPDGNSWDVAYLQAWRPTGNGQAWEGSVLIGAAQEPEWVDGERIRFS